MPPNTDKSKPLKRVDITFAPTPGRIREKAISLGFDVAGFMSAEDKHLQSLAPVLNRFIKRGYHGEMAWMASRTEERSHPKRLWPEVKSIIVLGLNYGTTKNPMNDLGQPDKGVVSIYAQGSDYHDLVKKRLKRLARWIVEGAGPETGVKVFVDTAPVMEKPIAELAGLGWRGKHTNLVSTEFGSWLFLGEIFTTLELPPDKPQTDHCGSCDACLRACPTGAFPRPYELDAKRCISYLTIEHKSEITPELMAKMGNRIYGCDDCLAVCPWTKFTQTHQEPKLAPRDRSNNPWLRDLAGLDDQAFRERFQGSPIKRTGRDRFLRNVAIALGNADNQNNRDLLKKLSRDHSGLVRNAATWALDRLKTSNK